MPFKCLRWMWDILYVIVPIIEFSSSHEKSAYLPDDVLINILERLPAESLLRCQNVCKQWRSLTTSPCFSRLYLERATPVIFMRVNNRIRQSHGGIFERQEPASFLFDHTTSGALKIKKLSLKERLMIYKDEYANIVSSCGGFLLFSTAKRFYFVNPLTQEHGGMYSPGPGYLCGFFYHSSRNEFKVLYALSVGNNYITHYYIYTLGANNWRKIEASPLPYSPPPGKETPAVCNGFLYWIVCRTSDWENSRPCSCKILVLGMDTEEFFLLPHPGEEVWDEFSFLSVNVLVKDDCLAFCSLNYCTGCPSNYCMGLIDVWILEDYASRSWVLKWRLNLHLAERPAVVEHGAAGTLKMFYIHNGELWVDCNRRGIYVYNLERNTVRRLGGPPWSSFVAFGRGFATHNCIPFTRSLLRLPKSMLT